MLPPGLELDTFCRIRFVAVALVEARSLRLSGVPKACGQDFFLAGYRIHAVPPSGRTDDPGLRILRSDTDRWPMVVGGNC